MVLTPYLITHPPVRQQWFKTRNKPLTGCTVLHTSESIMDSVGPDTGAENVAEFIRTRTTPGSYHDLVDSDSELPLVPYEHGAFHDGTGSNNWALSLSFACSTADWKRMTPAKRAAFLRNGAKAFARQQAWRKAHGLPLTELRYITKAQSDAGQSGFCCHGWRDPGRRSDPGVAAPNEFPFDEFLTHCRAAMAGTLEEDDMYGQPERDELIGRLDEVLGLMKGVHPAVAALHVGVLDPTGGLRNMVAELTGRDAEVDEEKLAAALAPTLVPAVMAAVGSQSGMTEETVKQAVRDVLKSLQSTLP